MFTFWKIKLETKVVMIVSDAVGGGNFLDLHNLDHTWLHHPSYCVSHMASFIIPSNMVTDILPHAFFLKV